MPNHTEQEPIILPERAEAETEVAEQQTADQTSASSLEISLDIIRVVQELRQAVESTRSIEVAADEERLHDKSIEELQELARKAVEQNCFYSDILVEIKRQIEEAVQNIHRLSFQDEDLPAIFQRITALQSLVSEYRKQATARVIERETGAMAGQRAGAAICAQEQVENIDDILSVKCRRIDNEIKDLQFQWLGLGRIFHIAQIRKLTKEIKRLQLLAVEAARYSHMRAPDSNSYLYSYPGSEITDNLEHLIQSIPSKLHAMFVRRTEAIFEQIGQSLDTPLDSISALCKISSLYKEYQKQQALADTIQQAGHVELYPWRIKQIKEPIEQLIRKKLNKDTLASYRQMKQDSEARRQMSEEEIADLDHMLEEVVIGQLLVIGHHNEQSVHCGYLLLEIDSPQAVVLNTLNAWREVGNNGETPFLRQHPNDGTISHIYQYLQRQSRETLAAAATLNPAVGELIGYILAEPRKYANSQRTEEYLTAAAKKILAEGSNDEKFFVLDLLYTGRVPLEDVLPELEACRRGIKDKDIEMGRRVREVVAMSIRRSRANRVVMAYAIKHEIKEPLQECDGQVFDFLSAPETTHEQMSAIARIFGTTIDNIRTARQTPIREHEKGDLHVVLMLLDSNYQKYQDSYLFERAINYWLRGNISLSAKQREDFIALCGRKAEHDDASRAVLITLMNRDYAVATQEELLRMCGMTADEFQRLEAIYHPTHTILMEDASVLIGVTRGNIKPYRRTRVIELWTSRQLELPLGMVNGLIDQAFEADATREIDEMVRRECQPHQEINSENWAWMLSGFLMAEVGEIPDQAESSKLKALFGPEQEANKELCYRELRRVYDNFLASNGEEALSTDVIILLNYIAENDGAFHLKYIGALGMMLNGLRKSLQQDTTTPTTRKKIIAGVSEQEQRFARERWDNTEQAAFYQISRDVLQAAPSLYSAYLDVFSALDAKEMKVFQDDVFPIDQALVFIVQQGEQGSGEEQLVVLRQRIKKLKKALAAAPDRAAKQEMIREYQAASLAAIKDEFRSRFGIMKLPEVWTADHLRTMHNFMRYLSNMNDLDEDRQRLLILFMSLTLNGEFMRFRRNQQVALAEYFDGENLEFYQQYFAERQSSDVLTADNLGIAPEQLEGFQAVLQEETVVQRLGNIETIDIKLGNLARNLQDLGDEDAYPNEQDKKALRLYKQYGKKVGAVLAKMFQEANGRQIRFTEEEELIKQQLSEIFGIAQWTTAEVKQIQDRTKSISFITNTLKLIEQHNIPEEIAQLQAMLMPPSAVVEIFNRLGEEFKPHSGALALAQDLEYLEDIIEKNQDKLSPEESEIVQKYLDAIRQQMQKLEGIYDALKEQITALKRSLHLTDQPLLRQRMEDIERTMQTQAGASVVFGRMTCDWNLIIENMRQCLGCQSKECNNDTNLTFGDDNKFHLLTQTNIEKGSIADELVYLFPMQYGERREISFIMDQVYGSKTADVLITHIIAVAQKYKRIRRQFPDIKLSIFITDAALTSVGLNREIMLARWSGLGFEGLSLETVDQPTITVNKSASGDHYLEFGGGGTRETGKRVVSGGLLIH